MIQRKQTLFLILAVIVSVCCLSLPVATLLPSGMGAPSQVLNLWIADGNGARDFSAWPRRQAALCAFCIFLLVVWYLLFAWLVFTGERATFTLTPELPLALPAVAIVLYFMARQGIMADERLVRSMDRIR